MTVILQSSFARAANQTTSASAPGISNRATNVTRASEPAVGTPREREFSAQVGPPDCTDRSARRGYRLAYEANFDSKGVRGKAPRCRSDTFLFAAVCCSPSGARVTTTNATGGV